MQLKSIKTAAEAPFEGVEFIKVDGNVTEVIIGGKLRIRKGESYSASLQVLIEAPGEVVKRYRVEATLDGFEPTIEHFEYSTDADDRAAHFKGIGADVVKTYGDVVINDAGLVVEGAATEPQSALIIDEVPF